MDERYQKKAIGASKAGGETDERYLKADYEGQGEKQVVYAKVVEPSARLEGSG